MTLTVERFPFEHGFGTRGAELDQESMASLRQVHSNRVIRADQPGCAGEGDALITRTPGVALSVRTADCYPILLADADGGAVAAIHAGWRGTCARIVGETIGAMRRQFGTEAADLFAAIGPGIGACCYQVGDEVARLFGVEGARKIDLAAANRAQLIECGVNPERIRSIGRCTFCEPEIFFSYRREGDKAGRMVSFLRRG